MSRKMMTTDKYKETVYRVIAQQIDRHITTFNIQLKELNDTQVKLAMQQDRMENKADRIEAVLKKMIEVLEGLNKKVVALSAKQ